MHSGERCLKTIISRSFFCVNQALRAVRIGNAKAQYNAIFFVFWLTWLNDQLHISSLFLSAIPLTPHSPSETVSEVEQRATGLPHAPVRRRGTPSAAGELGRDATLHVLRPGVVQRSRADAFCVFINNTTGSYIPVRWGGPSPAAPGHWSSGKCCPWVATGTLRVTMVRVHTSPRSAGILSASRPLRAGSPRTRGDALPHM